MKVSHWSTIAAAVIAAMLALVAAPATAASRGAATGTASGTAATEFSVEVQPLPDGLTTASICVLNVLPTVTKSSGRVYAKLKVTVPSACKTQTMHLRLYTAKGTVKSMAFTAIPGTLISISTNYKCQGTKKTVWAAEVPESLQVQGWSTLYCTQ